MTKIDPIATINAALSPATIDCIRSQEFPHPAGRRAIDFGCIDRALEAAAAMIAEGGPGARFPDGDSAAVKLASLQHVAAMAAPYRKARRA